tara:strand:- start:295 stop:549 length:255 start_codon:yes stop_codon:yes gene_type:complete
VKTLESELLIVLLILKKIINEIIDEITNKKKLLKFNPPTNIIIKLTKKIIAAEEKSDGRIRLQIINIGSKIGMNENLIEWSLSL